MNNTKYYKKPEGGAAIYNNVATIIVYGIGKHRLFMIALLFMTYIVYCINV